MRKDRGSTIKIFFQQVAAFSLKHKFMTFVITYISVTPLTYYYYHRKDSNTTASSEVTTAKAKHQALVEPQEKSNLEQSGESNVEAEKLKKNTTANTNTESNIEAEHLKNKKRFSEADELIRVRSSFTLSVISLK